MSVLRKDDDAVKNNANIARGEVARLIRENLLLKAELAEQRERENDLENALVELAELYAEQDDAIVELADIIGEME